MNNLLHSHYYISTLNNLPYAKQIHDTIVNITWSRPYTINTHFHYNYFIILRIYLMCNNKLNFFYTLFVSDFCAKLYHNLKRFRKKSLADEKKWDYGKYSTSVCSTCMSDDPSNFIASKRNIPSKAERKTHCFFL